MVSSFAAMKRGHDRPVFTHKKFDFDEVQTIEGDVRLYKTPKGNYPSITSILSVDPKLNKALDKWRKRLGIDEANAEASRCADRGTAVHDLIEKYVKNVPNYTKGHSVKNIGLFNRSRPAVNKLDNVVAQEIPLYSHALQLAGRVDFIGTYNGVPSVVDFKTSTKDKKFKWITNYFVQGAAYSYMFEEMFGVAIKNIVVLIVVEGSTVPQVFQVDRAKYRDELIAKIKFYRRFTSE